jgi:hypothetical protein
MALCSSPLVGWLVVAPVKACAVSFNVVVHMLAACRLRLC